MNRERCRDKDDGDRCHGRCNVDQDSQRGETDKHKIKNKHKCKDIDRDSLSVCIYLRFLLVVVNSEHIFLVGSAIV